MTYLEDENWLLIVTLLTGDCLASSKREQRPSVIMPACVS